MSTNAGFDRPIVILGAPRSGTTYLSHLIASHPAVVGAPESRLAWRFGNDRRSDELRPADARPAVVAHVHRYFARLMADHEGSRLLDKTPSNSVRPWFVDAVLPEARYVHIVRNGWSSVPSMREFWTRRGTGLNARQRTIARRRSREIHPRQVPYYLGEVVRRFVGGRHVALLGPRISGLQAVADEHGLLQAAGHQWRACVTSSATFGSEIGSDRYLEVKLESLDEAVVAEVVKFCELDPDEALMDRFRTTFDAGMALRLPDLDLDERRALEPLIQPANALLGYPGER